MVVKTPVGNAITHNEVPGLSPDFASNSSFLLICVCPWEATSDALTTWVPPTCETQRARLLASAWPSFSCHGHLGSQPKGRRFVSAFQLKRNFVFLIFNADL